MNKYPSESPLLSVPYIIPHYRRTDPITFILARIHNFFVIHITGQVNFSMRSVMKPKEGAHTSFLPQYISLNLR